MRNRSLRRRQLFRGIYISQRARFRGGDNEGVGVDQRLARATVALRQKRQEYRVTFGFPDRNQRFGKTVVRAFESRRNFGRVAAFRQKRQGVGP